MQVLGASGITDLPRPWFKKHDHYAEIKGDLDEIEKYIRANPAG